MPKPRKRPETGDDHPLDRKVPGPTPREVVVLDSCTFIGEAGLTSTQGSALRHYLYVREAKLAVPQVVVEQCERHLRNRAEGQVERVRVALAWLARLCGGVNGWTPPEATRLDERVEAAARGEAFDAVLIEETPALRERAETRHRAERPPSHRKDSLEDCKIWEHCLDLLRDGDVIFVSDDLDFRGRPQTNGLHPQLRAEADAVSGGRLTFHAGMNSLLSDLSAEVQRLPTEKVFAFVYDAVAEEVRELEANSGCRPTCAGSAEHRFFTTDRADIVEVRLEVTDQWESTKGEESLDFRLSGSCQFRLSDSELCDLSATRMGLYARQPDGTRRAVRGSYVSVSMQAYAGAPSVKPEPVPLWVAAPPAASE